MKCTHDNCMTCPYPDCISSEGPAGEKRKPGRKKIDPIVKKENERRRRQDYYLQNKDRIQAYSHDYYRTHAGLLRQKQRELRQQNSDDSNTKSVWINNGIVSKRVSRVNLDKYISQGWKRGRVLKPYKYIEEE